MQRGAHQGGGSRGLVAGEYCHAVLVLYDDVPSLVLGPNCHTWSAEFLRHGASPQLGHPTTETIWPGPSAGNEATGQRKPRIAFQEGLVRAWYSTQKSMRRPTRMHSLPQVQIAVAPKSGVEEERKMSKSWLWSLPCRIQR